MPNKMLHFTWNVPPIFEVLRTSNTHTNVKITFHAVNGLTQIVLENSGYLYDPMWLEVYAYFDKAWDYVLDNFAKLITEFQ
jgi:hypothetical protein